MIIDSMFNYRLYRALGEGIAVGLSLAQEPWLRTAQPGRYETSNDGIYILVQDYSPKPEAETRWEAHNKYIDIQYVTRGVEVIGHAYRPDLTPDGPYDPVVDVMFYSGTGNYFDVREHVFAIFFPQDAHRPGIARSGSDSVRKIVVKIPTRLIEMPFNV